MNHSARLVLAFTIFLAPLFRLGAEDIVHVGPGSYSTRLPDGAKAPQSAIYRTANVRGPMPTNDWWSSLAWLPLSDVMYPHPLAVRAVGGGLRVYYPGPNITANKSAIFGFMAGESDDFIIGHSAVEKFTEARVDGFSDWFVDALFEQDGKKLRTSFGHGSPCVFVTIEGGNPTLAFGKEAPKIWAGSAKDAVLGISVKNRHYGIFAPSGSTWSDLAATKWTCDAKGKNYFTVAVLPDTKPQTLAQFERWAHNHVTDTHVEWSYDEKRSAVTTKFSFTTKAYEKSTEAGTCYALYPHQWPNAKATLTSMTYDSVRGPMKLGAGTGFTTEMHYPGVMPSLPLAAKADKSKLSGFIADELKDKGRLTGDTYWLGKQLGKWATLIPLAEQAGDKAAADELATRIKASLENFFTATDAGGALKKANAGLFHYDANWGTLIGYPASYGSDDQLNDHHFHYGYFIRAAGEIARRDPAWAAKWGDMVRLLVRDIASPDHADKLFPFLRNFDPYAGHSWASGHARFADGNNNESSSEAMNAWYGLIEWSEATGDRALRDLGAWLFTTELEAIDDYWFDVTGQFHHKDFTPSVVTMIWGGKGANGTWFSGNPEMVHGINWLPVTGASLYLGRYPDYVRKNYAALMEENKADDEKKAAKDGGKTVPGDGRNWDAWSDIIWMYRALSDPADALAQFDARKPSLKPEGGNSFANAYAWITSLETLGEVDRTITADAPSYAVFSKSGKRTHVAYNFGDKPRAVTFSDGVTLQCPAKNFAVK
jgi:endoglucanase Acf2